MPRYFRFTFAGIILGVLIGVPWAYAAWRHQTYRNFHVVTDGVLYRSGQLSLDGLERVIHDHRIKTVITLRYPPSADQPAPDQAEEDFCKASHLHHFRLHQRAWTGTNEEGDKSVPAEENIKKFLEIVSDPKNQPVLVHCFAGIHRTGAMCAIYRMEFDHWTCAEAMREMREMGYTANHRDVFAYLESYRPRNTYYVIFDGADGGQQVIPLPVTGNVSVIDAISRVEGLAASASKHFIWLARPTTPDSGRDQILLVDWNAITINGDPATNHQIFPGDRLYVKGKPRSNSSNRLSQVFNPCESPLGVTFLSQKENK